MAGAVLKLPVAPVLEAPTRWTTNVINIVVIGAGGNGSEVVDCLASFHVALRSLGHPDGLKVTVIDDSVVRESNVVRQRFWPCDIGQYKALALINRYNLNLGTEWLGLPFRFPSNETQRCMASADVVISCVDVNSARRAIGDYEGTIQRDAIWLDMGNAHRNGQAVLGALHKVLRRRFPSVIEEYPEVESGADSNVKSCSVAESIASQDCLVNRTVATAAMNPLWELLRTGSTKKHWIMVNLETGEQGSYPFPNV